MPQGNPVERPVEPTHHAGQHETRTGELHEEQSPSGGRHVDRPPPQPGEQQQRVHARTNANAQGQAGMREMGNEHHVAQLRDDQHRQCDLHGRLDILFRIEARRQYLDQDQPKQPDPVRGQCARYHFDIVTGKTSVVEQCRRQRLGIDEQCDSTGRGQQEREPQPPVEQRRVFRGIGVRMRLGQARQQDRAKRHAQQRGRELHEPVRVRQPRYAAGRQMRRDIGVDNQRQLRDRHRKARRHHFPQHPLDARVGQRTERIEPDARHHPHPLQARQLHE
ncbi:hypothetical protein DFQ30_011194, partial [Apophysomyces sp. BC1015]